MEDNNKDKGFVFTEGEQNFNIVTAIPAFKINQTNSENIASSLRGKAVAKLAGNFIAKVPGKNHLKAIFNYEEGSTESIETVTDVVAVKLEISLVSPNPFPVSLPKNFEQEVEFVIKYSNNLNVTLLTKEQIAGLAATGILIEGLDELDDVSINKEMSDDQTISHMVDIEEFKKKVSKDSTVKLEPGYQFRIKGTFRMSNSNKTLRILCRYVESAYLDESDKEGAKLEKTINIKTLKILSEVKSKLPTKIKLGSAHQVVFQFTNQSEKFPVTGVKIKITESIEMNQD